MTEHILVQDPQQKNVVVIGNGPVGVHFVNQLLTRNWSGSIRIFGEEEYLPYNRVQLSAFLNREITLQQIQNPIRQNPGQVEEIFSRIESIDRESCQVTDSRNRTYHYDILVLATGSHPHIPDIPGRELKRIYRFRDMKDVEHLMARLYRTRHTVIIGGGLLGLETAKAMSRYSTQVTVIQHTPGLMNRQLDEEASCRIRHYAEELGISFKLNCSVREICGETQVDELILSDGSVLPCDTLIFATGIRPRHELALASGLSVRQGIRIDSRLRTSDPNIYAIGECADFNDQVFGLVAPGLEQAGILALNLSGGNAAYQGTTLVSELKVLGLKVFSIGKVGEEYARQIDQSWVYKSDHCYRRIFLQKGKIAGAIAIGPWQQIKALQAALADSKRLWPWQKFRFRRSGNLFQEHAGDLAALPAATIICNCQQVSLGRIRQSLSVSCSSLQALQEELGVASVCGTCKPLLQQLLQQPVELLPVKVSLLVKAALAACIATTFLLLPALSVQDSVQSGGLDWLWTESLPRQISGFIILGLVLLSLLLTFRKRISRLTWLNFSLWRGAHIVLSLVALAVLFIHTGISLGEGINRWLIINFFLIALVGTGSAALAAVEGSWLNTRIKSAKRTLVFCHIVSFWPLPVLLTFHVLSVYYF